MRRYKLRRQITATENCKSKSLNTSCQSILQRKTHLLNPLGPKKIKNGNKKITKPH